MKTNENLEVDVRNALSWERSLKSAQIGVGAMNGVVTLTGVVDEYCKKIEAEIVVKKVTGVRALVEKIEVRYASSDEISDNEMADKVLAVLRNAKGISASLIQVTVENGSVRLEGVLQWNYQKLALAKLVGNLIGIKELTLDIQLKPELGAEVDKNQIEQAISRNSSLASENILVDVIGSQVNLSGLVHSFHQKDEAESIAWNALGVTIVDNSLEIEYNLIDQQSGRYGIKHLPFFPYTAI